MDNTLNLFSQELEKPVVNTRKIKKISINNFRNIESKEYILNGDNILLQGENGIGKTNVLEAVYWALTGYIFNGDAKADSQGLKPNGSPKDVVTSVKIDFEYQSFSFERTLKEKWSKDKTEYKGTDTTLVVNGASEKNQKTALSKLAEHLNLEKIENVFKKEPTLSKVNLYELLYNTNFLKNGMDYKEIRAIIIDMVGEVDFKDIINEKPETYSSLVEPLKEHGLDLAALKTNTKDKIFNKANGYNKRIADSEAVIKDLDEKSKQVIDKDELFKAKEEKEKITKEIESLKKQKVSSDEDLIKDYENQITQQENLKLKREQTLREEHQEKINNMKTSHNQESLVEKESSLSKLRDDRLTLSEKIQDREKSKNVYANLLSQKKNSLELSKSNLETLKEKHLRLTKPENEETYTCPHCGDTFKLSETKEYKVSVESKIADVKMQGKETNETIQGLKEGIESLEDDITIANDKILEAQEERNQLDTKIKAIEEDIQNLKTVVENEQKELPKLDLENDQTLKEIKENISGLELAKKSLNEKDEDRIENLNNEIKELEEKLIRVNLIIGKETMIIAYAKDAEKERKNNKVLNEELMLHEQRFELIKQLEKETYERLDEKVGKTFGENVKFRLWKQNIDGTYDTRLCDVFVKDIHDNFVNIKTINTGMYPVRAIEILGKIKEHYGINKSFVFVDELGSLDETHKKMLLSYGEQVFATQVGTTKTIEETRL